MGTKGGVALKSLQWFIRGIQFLCAAVVLSLFSYFLATLHNHGIEIATWIRAVEGISGSAVLYTLIGLLLLCCLAGHTMASAVAIFLDILFAGAFIYIASANRTGASSCNGFVDTPFGAGDADSTPTGNQDGFTKLPSLRSACKMETACFAVSLVAILFFLFSILVELALVRHRRHESRYGPSPANNYTSGSGTRGGGFLGRFRRNKNRHANDPNALPTHTSPNQVRDSYTTENTAVGHEATHHKHGEAGYGEPTAAGHHNDTVATHPPSDYRYNDGTYDRYSRV